MIITSHHSEAVATEPLELLRTMLEEQFVIQTNKLTELTVYGQLHGRRGNDRQALDALAGAARQSIADTAHALRRMSEGSYGICEGCRRPIPIGRLHAVPHARYCTRCQQQYSE